MADELATLMKVEKKNYEELRKRNLEDNKRVLATLMADIKSNPQPVSPPKKPRKKRLSKDPAKEEIVRRNPVRNTRFHPDRFDIPRMRSRSGSVSSTISSCSSIGSMSASSDKLVVRFGFFKRPADDASPVKNDKESDPEYEEEDDFHPLPQVNRKPRSQHVVKAVEDVTQQDLDMVASLVSDKKYDSIYGTTCHQCRQKTNDMKTICRSEECCGVRGQFCGPCLRNRYGECAKTALKDPEWICPPCRDICNCSFCRKKKGKAPTGIFIHMAREKGYHDVCSYLQRNEK